MFLMGSRQMEHLDAAGSPTPPPPDARRALLAEGGAAAALPAPSPAPYRAAGTAARAAARTAAAARAMRDATAGGGGGCSETKMTASSSSSSSPFCLEGESDGWVGGCERVRERKCGVRANRDAHANLLPQNPYSPRSGAGGWRAGGGAGAAPVESPHPGAPAVGRPGWLGRGCLASWYRRQRRRACRGESDDEWRGLCVSVQVCESEDDRARHAPSPRSLSMGGERRRAPFQGVCGCVAFSRLSHTQPSRTGSSSDEYSDESVDVSVKMRNTSSAAGGRPDGPAPAPEAGRPGAGGAISCGKSLAARFAAWRHKERERRRVLWRECRP